MKKISLIAAALFLAAGCATHTPVGVSRLGEEIAYDQINRSALNSRSFSSQTLAVLHRHHLDKAAHRDPLRCIRELHATACRDDRRDTLLALAELCFKQGKRGATFKTESGRIGAMSMYVASACYAYHYLLGPGEEPAPSPYDRRFRVACDIYNRSLALALLERGRQPHADELAVALPVGAITLVRGFSDLPWPIDAYEAFVPADNLLVRGLTVRNRSGGLGAPLVASLKRQAGFPVGNASAATLFVRVDGSVRELADGTARGWVDVYSPLTRNAVIVNGHSVPIETDMTVQLAYVLDNPFLWSLGMKMFRMGQMPYPQGIYTPQPYERGKMPVILVHGTMSSPVWWTEMMNTLASDATLRENYQFWLYLYDSAKPIVFSARNFQEAIASQVAKNDPDGTDAAMGKMVVIGHSQGGLLTRLAATDTGEAIVRQVTGKTLQELNLDPKELEVVRHYAVFKPVPQVRRVVFMSTPHRGSFLAGSFARSLARRFIRLPQSVLRSGAELLTITDRVKLPGTLTDGMPTSIDSMAPGNPLLTAVADLAFPPQVTAHSIIAVKPGMKPPEGDDGVVKYASAHLEGVASEFVVSSPHSCQRHPDAIEEVRRILLEHLEGRQ